MRATYFYNCSLTILKTNDQITNYKIGKILRYVFSKKEFFMDKYHILI